MQIGRLMAERAARDGRLLNFIGAGAMTTTSGACGRS